MALAELCCLIKIVVTARFMALNDLMTQVKIEPSSLTGDEITERKVLQHVLKLVQDKISEVKNQAVKWYARRFSFRNLIVTQSRAQLRTVDQNCSRKPDGFRG